MLSTALTHAALLDVQHGKPLPTDVLAYFIARGFVATADPPPADAAEAPVHLTDAGRKCLLEQGT